MIFLLACILAVAHAIETLTGFGSAVVALSLGAHVIPLNQLLPAVVCIGLLQSLWLVYRGWTNIRWATLLRSILPGCGVGLGLGLFAASHLNATHLRWSLGLFVVISSALELLRLNRQGHGGRPLKPWIGKIVLTSAGFVHGILATGGPLAVIYASRAIPEKGAFRATLSALWLILGAGLVMSFTLHERMDGQTLRLAGMLVPGFLAGILMGERLHSRVNEWTFRNVVQVVLVFSGLSLLMRTD